WRGAPSARLPHRPAAGRRATTAPWCGWAPRATTRSRSPSRRIGGGRRRARTRCGRSGAPSPPAGSGCTAGAREGRWCGGSAACAATWAWTPSSPARSSRTAACEGAPFPRAAVRSRSARRSCWLPGARPARPRRTRPSRAARPAAG
ncbi:MAG: hypothetical protein AVDCRST_MAG68-157, partial [uncultured Gemmatimonadetes bacterium]